MSRKLRWQRFALILGLLTFFSMGCTPATIWTLFGGDKKRPAEHPLKAKDKKDEITIAILPNAVATLGTDFAGVHRELAEIAAKRFMEETKDDKHPIKVIELSKVEKFQAANPNWKIMTPGKIAKQLGADYLIDLDVREISMFQPDYGREAFAGKALISVATWDADEPDKAINQYVLSPQSNPKTASTTTPDQYRREFVDRIAAELAWKHVPQSQRTIGPSMR